MISRKKYTLLVNLYSDRICTYLTKNLSDNNLAQDLTQDCFLKLWKNRFLLKEEIVKSWLFKTAYNSMLNHYRDNKRMSFDSEAIIDARSYLNESLETSNYLETIFLKLSGEQKSLILLKDYEGYKYEEIADIMNLTLQNVKVKLYRARKKVKEEIDLLENDERRVRL